MTRSPGGGTTLPEEWHVRLPVFEGPLDLLLQLVRVNEVDIYDIPVALVCDQFHEYLGLMEDLNLDVAADYIYTAALLIHLKSRMLLPRKVTEAGEEEDPRQELVERLIEYRKLKDASQSLAELHSLRLGIFTRERQPLPSAKDDPEAEIDLSDVSLYDLLKAFRDVLVRYDHEHPDPLLLQRESFSVREQFDRLLGSLSLERPFDVLEDLRSRSCRAEAVAGFLAVLELARLGLARFHQTEQGEVLLYRTEREVAEAELETVQA